MQGMDKKIPNRTFDPPPPHSPTPTPPFFLSSSEGGSSPLIRQFPRRFLQLLHRKKPEMIKLQSFQMQFEFAKVELRVQFEGGGGGGGNTQTSLQILYHFPVHNCGGFFF